MIGEADGQAELQHRRGGLRIQHVEDVPKRAGRTLATRVGNAHTRSANAGDDAVAIAAAIVMFLLLLLLLLSDADPTDADPSDADPFDGAVAAAAAAAC